MGNIQRLCEPYIVFSRQSSVSSAATASPGDTGGPSVEGPAVVSCSVGNVVRLSTAISSHIDPISTDIRCQLDGSGTPTSRMAYLWQKVGGGNLSEAAKELLLAPGEAKHLKPMTHTLRNGWAGVLKGVSIPFQEPFQM